MALKDGKPRCLTALKFVSSIFFGCDFLTRYPQTRVTADMKSTETAVKSTPMTIEKTLTELARGMGT
jgi:hypothetical protein